jgi:hypothetical protein
MSNFWVFWVNLPITLYFFAMARHQSWFRHFSAGPLGRQARQKTVQRKSLPGWPCFDSPGIVAAASKRKKESLKLRI